ncbi:MAG: hypothetical protein JO337_03670 [Acidimicrobiales bacterium]|nr:hypothetical protein [Acidimicrobiales bacterium]
MTDVLDQAVRCSAWARAEALDPIGSVGSYEGFVLAEVPLPWPHDVGLVPELSGLAAVAAENRLRLQALVPKVRSDERRLILHSRPVGQGDWFDGFRRHAGIVSGPDLAANFAALEQSAEEPGRDLLVCTHGRRDVCCGSAGTVLAQQLTSDEWSPGLTLWRTSHTGGHRFAPTFLMLPEATGWAFADPDLARLIAERSVPFARVAAHYRGCAGLPGPTVQAVERQVLTREGWAVLDRPRRGFETGESDQKGGRAVRLEVGDSRGGHDAWEAVVAPGRVLPVPDCGQPLSAAKKTETEWIVSDLRQV